jgi:hypothetical protein
MKMLAFALLTATLVGQSEALADKKQFGCDSPPCSFAPHPGNKRHSYGAPIQPPIVSRAKPSHHKTAHGKTTVPNEH